MAFKRQPFAIFKVFLFYPHPIPIICDESDCYRNSETQKIKLRGADEVATLSCVKQCNM